MKKSILINRCGGYPTLLRIFKYLQMFLPFMDTITNLEFLGLTYTESKIYVALLKIGESTVVELAKKTSVHRRTIYDNLNMLIQKGLVNYNVKGGTKFYSASNPSVFQSILEEKNKVLKNF